MKTKAFYYSFLVVSLILLSCQAKPKYELVWAEEFETEGRLDEADWNYEHGFVRNHEHQWYQQDNARIADGCLVIEARHDSIPNPGYRPRPDSDPSRDGRERRRGRDDWRSSRPYAEYSSASVNTRGKHEWLYGRFEVRAKIPTASGSWPAIWTLGVSKPWPMNGEIDIMEYYRINASEDIL